MLYLISGLVIGLVMGLTGAGGALIAIPLFIYLLGMTLKSASVYSLVAVVLASSLNFMSQRRFAQNKTALLIIIFSGVGSYLSVPLKASISPLVISILLTLISLFALYSVWFPARKKEEAQARKINIILTSFIGMALGGLTTFTGLGGGVLMLPLFLSIYQYSTSEAVATSLLVVSLSSLVSLILQLLAGATFSIDGQLLWLVAGMLISIFVLKYLTKTWTIKVLTRVRQVVFTVVVLLAIGSLF